MRASIRTKLLGGFLILLLLVIGIGIYMVRISERALEDAVGQGSVFLVEDMLQRIEGSIFLVEEELIRFTSDSLLQRTLDTTNRIEVNTPDSAMMMPMHYALSEHVRDTFIRFSEVRYGYRQYNEVLVTNASGVVIAGTTDGIPRYYADAPWWHAAKEHGIAIGAFEYDSEAGIWGIPLAVRVDDMDGAFIGILRAVFPVGAIVRGEELAGKRYDTTEVMLVTTDGALIYKTGPFRFLGDVSSEDFFQRLTAHSGSFVATQQGSEKLFSYAHADGTLTEEKLGWILIMSHDTDEVFSPVSHLGLLVGLAIACLMIGTALLAFFLWRSVSVPIQNLTTAARAIAAGDRKRRVTVVSEDEVGALGAAFNTMTERLTRAIERLEIGKAHDEAILSSFGDGLVVTDEQLVVRKVNPAALSMLGKKESDVVGALWPELLERIGVINEHNQPVVRALLPTRSAAQEKRRVYSDAYYYRRSDGTFFPVSITAAPIIREGTVIGVVEVFRDITSERTIERARSEFISFVAHQMRVPLSSMRVFCEKLMREDVGTLTDIQRRYVAHTHGAADRLFILIRNLLDVARLEGGRLQVATTTVLLEELIEKQIQGITPFAQLKNCRIVFQKTTPLSQVSTDPILLGEVLHNIFANAVQYTDKTSSIVTVAVRADADAYCICVCDEGVGISKEAQGRVFEKFFRAENNEATASKTQAESSGLGLYAAKLIMDMLGGRIWFLSPNQNKDGRTTNGTTFYITIPKNT